MVSYTVLAWAMLASAFGGVAVSWTFNKQVVKALYAIERARHHWDATKDWIHRLMEDFRRLAMLAAVMSVVLVGGVGGAWWVTVHGLS